ncbi:hypothetical protein RvY_15657 [Ramazzottius varieornatus]|uniref:phosphatidylinositol-3,5-bisphosphate 3-phosphatase n=1 Tax=Ramazzottius varieornatus TaxID=947166 RepID=A0A1D1W3J9_RAMVA|nr:hypothetical protein RvY_15657 [Ramazzottius varieornatus]
MTPTVDSNQNDLVHINASEYFPKRAWTCDDPDLTVPFPVISGEYVEYLGRTAEEGIIALSNYRIFIQYPQSYVNLPVRMIEQADIQTYTNSIIFTCKNGTTVRCSFLTADRTLEWQKRILNAIAAPKKLEDIFAFAFYAWRSEERSGKRELQDRCFNTLSSSGCSFDLLREAQRMKFDLEETWRLSEINVKYEISPTYPRLHIVPACVPDSDLNRIAEFRSSRRFPSIIWRHRKNGAVIARSSQPELGFFGWRCAQDENLLQYITKACLTDRPSTPGSPAKEINSNGLSQTDEAASCSMPKLLILDARSYAAAVANRAKGGGSEYAEYYPNCEIQYMSMANIHTVRKSFYQLRQLCTSPADRVDFMSTLDKSLWLHHVSAIIRTTCHVTNALDVEGRPVLVHCSDGWDRTTQIVALAMLMMDSHYRTIRGFQMLIEWQWLEFGHKFADRCGHSLVTDETERCPIFLQWLDCVFQLVCQFPVDFEFNEAYLIHVAHHSYSCFFGTFLCNNPREREKNSVNDRTYSLWSYLQQEADECFSNLLYTKREMILRPDFSVRNLVFWANLYITELNPLSANVHPPEVQMIGLDPKIGNPSMPRTRSVEQLTNNVLATQSMDVHLHRSASALNLLSADTNGATDEDSASGSPSESSPLSVRSLHKSISLPNTQTISSEGEEDELTAESKVNQVPIVSQSTPHLITAVPLIESTSSESELIPPVKPHSIMERSTDTITGEDNIQGILLERYPSNQDMTVRSDDEEPTDEEVSLPLNDTSETVTFSTSRENFENGGSPSYKNGLRNGLPMENGHKISESLITSAMSTFTEPNGFGGMSIPKRMGTPNYLTASLTPTPLKMVEVNHHTSPINSPTRPRRTSRHLTSASSNDSLHSEGNESYQDQKLAVVRRQLGPDGLAILFDERQTRLRQIRDTYQKEVDNLRRELSSVKMSMKQHNGLTNGNGSYLKRELCLDEHPLSMEPLSLGADVVDYGTSYGSDVSWDNIDDETAKNTPWVPDQCVTKCHHCESRFWLGKRKHHCRKCGLVFCRNCSDYQVPLPQDRLFSPVRVCYPCYIEQHKQNNGVKVPFHRPPQSTRA